MANLPIVQLENKIIERLEQNQVVVIIGETSGGKSTQLPVSDAPPQRMHTRERWATGQVLWNLMVLCLEGCLNLFSSNSFMCLGELRRRLVLGLGEEVGYAIRFEDGTSERTQIKYLTNGVLLRVRVFSSPPRNFRHFIVATNIAETSLTVDGVVFERFFCGDGGLNTKGKSIRFRYVIDSGYVKKQQLNPETGMHSLDVVQISKLQANQHAGRAGRTRSGKCYWLYPSRVYNDEFLDVTVPKIQRSSLVGRVLYLKSLDLPDIDILKFYFLDPLSTESLEDALKQLYLIDGIGEIGTITSIGRTMAELPLEPSLSRILIEANEYVCLPQALTVAAMLSAETNLLPGQRSKIVIINTYFSLRTARATRRKGNTLLWTFLMVLVLVITSSCYRSMNAEMKMSMILAGAKIMTCRCEE
ncbi:hypothetical protein REPUB_Repub01dG0075100 [Reevesia pubescens]